METGISQRIKSVVIEQLGLKDEEYGEELTFIDMGADSLDNIELLMALEEELSITIEDKEAEKLKTPKDVLHLCARKKK